MTSRTVVRPPQTTPATPRRGTRPPVPAHGRLAGLQRMADQSPATQRLQALQLQANASARPLQREAVEEDEMQMVADPAHAQTLAPQSSGPVIQGAFSAAALGTTAAPVNQANLRAWILANCSAHVQALITRDDTMLRIRWDDTLGDHAETDMELVYTDASGGAGTLNLFAGSAVTDLEALDLPLQNYTVRVMTDLRPGGDVAVGAPMAVNARTTWQGTLAHELETHTKLAQRVYENLEAMSRPKVDIESKRSKMTNSVEARTGDAEHEQLASGNLTMSTTFTNAVESADRAEQVNIMIDIAWDRTDHAEDHLDDNASLRLAYRDILKWLKATAGNIQNLNMGEKGRIDALKDDLNTRIAGTY